MKFMLPLVTMRFWSTVSPHPTSLANKILTAILFHFQGKKLQSQRGEAEAAGTWTLSHDILEHTEKCLGLWWHDMGSNPTLTPASWITLSKWLNVSESQFSHLSNRMSTPTSLSCKKWMSNSEECLKDGRPCQHLYDVPLKWERPFRGETRGHRMCSLHLNLLPPYLLHGRHWRNIEWINAYMNLGCNQLWALKKRWKILSSYASHNAIFTY